MFGIIDSMAHKQPAPPSYADRLVGELETIATDYQAILADSSIRPRNLESAGMIVMTANRWAWETSTADGEARRMALLQRLRAWGPRFRLLFPHPTPQVQHSLDDGLGLLEDWLVRANRAKHHAPRDMSTATQKVAAAVAKLQALADLLPADDWHVRVVVDTNTLLDDPDVTLYQGELGPRYMVHLLPVVLREIDDKKRDGRTQDLREAAKQADRRLKGLRHNGDVLVGVRVAGEVHAVFEHIEPQGDGLPDWLDLTVPDDRFLASTLLLQSRHPGARVYVATSDINLQTKLAAVGLPFVEP
ncbi:PIN domain-containing protein [Streptomyces sp. NPDC059718]